MHTLGRFECDGRLSSALNKGFPTSCADLWRNGFVANGLYSIKGSKQVEKVYCDFNKLPSEPGNNETHYLYTFASSFYNENHDDYIITYFDLKIFKRGSDTKM
jgi:hypothetical protein